MKKFIVGVLSLLIFYSVITSLEKVPPRTVKLVREIGYQGNRVVLKTRPLVNEEDKAVWVWKQPKIPLTGIGYLEKEISLDKPKRFSTKFALYTKDEKTGKKEDREYAQAYIVEGEVKITDWEKFVSLIDLDQLNFERGKSPFVRAYRDRVEVIGEQVKEIIKTGRERDIWGSLIKTKEGYFLMNLLNRINYWEGELISRRNFVIALRDRLGFKTQEEIRNFIEQEAPWYWLLGVNTFEQLVNEYQRLLEYPLIPYLKDLSPKMANQRYTPNEEYLELLSYVSLAYQYEEIKVESQRKLKDLYTQKRLLESELGPFTKERVHLLSQSFFSYLAEGGIRLTDLYQEELLTQQYDTFLRKMLTDLSYALRSDRLIRDLQLQLNRAEKELSSLDEETREKARDLVKRFTGFITGKMGKKLWEFDLMELSRIFSYYLAKEKKEGLSSFPLGLAWVLLMREYVASLDQRKEEAIEFLNAYQFSQKMYQELSWLFQRKSPDPEKLIQIAQLYAEVFQNASRLINLTWQEKQILLTQKIWERRKKEVLLPYFQYYREATSEIALATRRIPREENEALWEAAIREGLFGEDITRYRPFVIYKTVVGDTLAAISNKYKVEGKDIFEENIDVVFQSLKKDRQRELGTLFLEEREKLYKLVKDVPLKPGSVLIINRVKKYSEEWFKKQEEYRRKREEVVKRFVYPWVEEFAPRFFQRYVEATPYLDQLERIYGIEFSDIHLRIEPRSIFPTPGVIDEDFYDLYEIKIKK